MNVEIKIMKLRANELRIGNIIDLGHRIGKIGHIGFNTITVFDLEETQDTLERLKRAKPIPLTEEWLVKLGFEYRGNLFIKEMDNQLIAIGKDLSYGLYRSFENYSIGSSFGNGRKLHHVHQLQNLYFALTGEELTFKQL